MAACYCVKEYEEGKHVDGVYCMEGHDENVVHSDEAQAQSGVAEDGNGGNDDAAHDLDEEVLVDMEHLSGV